MLAANDVPASTHPRVHASTKGEPLAHPQPTAPVTCSGGRVREERMRQQPHEHRISAGPVRDTLTRFGA
ncbi:hypothetical protein ACWEPC_56020, partial [Nonomuraea sp. NPDC004297]